MSDIVNEIPGVVADVAVHAADAVREVVGEATRTAVRRGMASLSTRQLLVGAVATVGAVVLVTVAVKALSGRDDSGDYVI